MAERTVILCLLLLLLAAACAAPQPNTHHAAAPQLELTVHPGSDWAGSDLALGVNKSGDGWQVRLDSTADSPPATLLLDLRFDPAWTATDLHAPDLSAAELALIAGRDGAAALGVMMPAGELLAIPADAPLLSFTLVPTGRLPAQAPQDEDGAVGDLTAQRNPGGVALSWSYINSGDYDQNLEVNAADLAPIASRMRLQAEDLEVGFPFADVESVIDGDGNGGINAADIVPIAANLRNRVTHYRVYGSAVDSGAEETLEQLLELPFGDGMTEPGKRRTFALALDDPTGTAHQFFFVAPYDSSDETLGALSNPADAGSPDTDPPVWTSTTGLTAATPRNGAVQLSWGEATDELSPPVVFIVYWAATADFDFATATTIEISAPQTSHLVAGLTNDTEYSFAVRARDSAPEPNIELNEQVLTATPVDVLFAAPGLAGPVFDPVQFPSLALLPGGELVDPQAPLIVHTLPDTNALRLGYVRSGGWSAHGIAPGMQTSHPQVLVEGTRRYIVAFDATTKRIVAQRYSELWEPLSSTVIHNLAAGQRVLQLSADYDAARQAVGIGAAIGNDDNAEVRYFELADGAVGSTDPLRPLLPGIVQGLEFSYDPLGGAPWLVYTHGTLDRSRGYELDMELVTSRLEGDAWTQQDLGYSTEPLQLDLIFSDAGVPYLAFIGASTRDWLMPPIDLSLQLNGFAGIHDGTAWQVAPFFAASQDAIVDTFPPDFYRIELRGLLEVSWAEAGKLVCSIVEGHLILDWQKVEPQEGKDHLQISTTYRTEADNYAAHVGGFFSEPALALDWAAGGSAAAYLRIDQITGAQLWDRYFVPAGPLEYFAAP